MNLLWPKSPLMSRRFPLAFVAVVASVALAVAATLAAPLFLQSTRVASLTQGLDQAQRWVGGYVLDYSTGFFEEKGTAGSASLRRFADRMSSALGQRFAPRSEVAGPYVTFLGSTLSADGPTGEANVRLVNRTDALQNITQLSGSGRDGLWIADRIADQIGVEAGDEVRLTSPAGGVTATVAGVYRFLQDERRREYWSSLTNYIYRESSADADPPTLLFANRRTYESLNRSLRDFGRVRFEFPLERIEMSPETAEELAARFSGVTRDLRVSGSELSEAEGPFVDDWAGRHLYGYVADTALPGIVDSARERVKTVTPIVDLLAFASRLLALATVAAAGFFLVQRRRDEVVALLAKGFGPGWQAARFGAEAVVPCAVAVVIGATMIHLVMGMVGPAKSLPAQVLFGSSLEAGTTAVISLAVLVAAAMLSVRAVERSLAGSSRSLAVVRAGEFLFVAAAASTGLIAYRMLGAVRSTPEEGPPGGKVILIPLLIVVAGAVVGSALTTRLLRGLAPALKFRSPPLFLAIRRITTRSGMSSTLIVAAACSLAVSVYGLTILTTVRETATAKGKLFVGSDIAAPLPSSSSVPDIRMPTTIVTKVDRAGLTDGSSVSILAVDPTTFTRAAYWDDSFSKDSLADMMGRIEGTGDDIPVITVGDAGVAPSLATSSEPIALDSVGHAETFPGVLGRSMIVMTEQSLREVLSEGSAATTGPESEIWGRGDPSAIENALTREGVLFYAPLTIDQVLGTPTLKSLLLMLGLVGAMGMAAASVSVIALLLFLQARHRSAMVTTAFVRRMGLSPVGEYFSWASEMVGALLISLAVAVSTGIPVSLLMAGRLDPRPSLPPDAVVVVPGALIGVLGGVLTVVALAAAGALKITADKTNVGRLFRT